MAAHLQTTQQSRLWYPRSMFIRSLTCTAGRGDSPAVPVRMAASRRLCGTRDAVQRHGGGPQHDLPALDQPGRRQCAPQEVMTGSCTAGCRPASSLRTLVFGVSGRALWEMHSGMRRLHVTKTRLFVAGMAHAQADARTLWISVLRYVLLMLCRADFRRGVDHEYQEHPDDTFARMTSWRPERFWIYQVLHRKALMSVIAGQMPRTVSGQEGAAAESYAAVVCHAGHDRQHVKLCANARERIRGSRDPQAVGSAEAVVAGACWRS